MQFMYIQRKEIDKMNGFEIPVCLIMFKRPEKTVQIISQLRYVKPQKVYFISDGGRNPAEWEIVSECRRRSEEAIDWDCEIIRDYADKNLGVYDRIGLGALRVFEKEKWAIFLEDDNFPEVSFFDYCRDMLLKYEHEDKIMWVCGTNYLGRCGFQESADYGFSQQMLPCGWASWASKFTKLYDKEFSLYSRQSVGVLKRQYIMKRLFFQDVKNWEMEIAHRAEHGRYTSWDYQMGFSLRIHNKFGIIPRINQIKNIGVDEFSTHGGASMNLVMTKRFCEIPTDILQFPLRHPTKICIDQRIERRLEEIILIPLWWNLRSSVSKVIRRILRIPEGVSTRDYLLRHERK